MTLRLCKCNAVLCLYGMHGSGIYAITIISKEPLVEFLPNIIIDRARGLRIEKSDGGIFFCFKKHEYWTSDVQLSVVCFIYIWYLH